MIFSPLVWGVVFVFSQFSLTLITLVSRLSRLCKRVFNEDTSCQMALGFESDFHALFHSPSLGWTSAEKVPSFSCELEPRWERSVSSWAVTMQPGSFLLVSASPGTQRAVWSLSVWTWEMHTKCESSLFPFWSGLKRKEYVKEGKGVYTHGKRKVEICPHSSGKLPTLSVMCTEYRTGRIPRLQVSSTKKHY